MRRTIIIYGLAMAALLGLLKLVEYKFFVRDIPLEFYIGAIAVLFTALGIWAGSGSRGQRSSRSRSAGHLSVTTPQSQKLGIASREYEVLELIAAGLSNQDIADKPFRLDLHCKDPCFERLAKLDASRRTEAIAKAKELRIIP